VESVLKLQIQLPTKPTGLFKGQQTKQKETNLLCNLYLHQIKIPDQKHLYLYAIHFQQQNHNNRQNDITLIINKQANTCLISFYKRVPMMGMSYS